MPFTSDLKKKLKDKIEKQKQLVERKKIEKELIDTFERYARGIKQDLYDLNESPQLLNAVRLADVFREMCEKIGNDPELSQPQFYNLMNVVRRWDREIERLIEDMKYRFEYDNPDKFRVEARRSTDYAKHILHALKAIIEEYNEMQKERLLLKEEKERERSIKKGAESSEDKGVQDPFALRNIDLESEEGIKKAILGEYFATDTKQMDKMIEEYEKYGERAPISLRVKKWLKDKSRPEDIPENRRKIEDFRSSMSEIELKKIEMNLGVGDELFILNMYLENVFKLIEFFESLGYYNHVIALSDAWMKTLEKLADIIRTPGEPSKFSYKNEAIEKLLQQIRKHYRFMEDWIGRVERKYEIEGNKNPNEPKINKKLFQNLLSYYDFMRNDYIRRLEDRRILKEIASNERKQKRTQFIEKARNIIESKTKHTGNNEEMQDSEENEENLKDGNENQEDDNNKK